jgi:hypothetical protein
VSTLTSTLMPTRSGGFPGALSTRTRMGMRCTTLTQLPLEFSAGSSEKLEADAGEMLSTVPVQVWPGYVWLPDVGRAPAGGA